MDFGIRYRDYATDVTLSVVREPLSREQEEMIALVEEAYRIGVGTPGRGGTGLGTRPPGQPVFSIPRDGPCPTAWGHAVGLDVHETPALRENKNKEDEEVPLEEGDVFHGGTRALRPQMGRHPMGERFSGHPPAVVEAMTDSRILRLKGG